MAALAIPASTARFWTPPSSCSAETDYHSFSVDAIARRAGTSKPAIYRRWPSKAHLVHEAVFPISEATELPATGVVPGDMREMMRRTVGVLTTPAARAALPGLVGEMAADPTLHAALLERFAHILSDGLDDWLDAAVTRGEVRPEVTRRRHRRRDRRHHLPGAHHPRRHPRRRVGGPHRRTHHERHQRMTDHESTAAWRELLDTLGGLDRTFLEGDRAVTDDRHIADGYRMLATTLGVAFDTYLFADPSRPLWVEVNSPVRPDRRWGGDNTDAYYFMCPVDPNRRYRISGNSRRQRLLLGDRLQRAVARRVVGPDRGDRARRRSRASMPTATSPSTSGRRRTRPC